MSDGTVEPPARAIPEALASVIPAYLLESASLESLLTRLQRMAILLEKLQDEAVADFDISFADFVLLATLRREPAPHELPVSLLAVYVLRPMGSISQAVNRVEKRGLVRRRDAENDRRKVIVGLTEEGLRFADEVHEAYEAIRTRVFRDLDDAQLVEIHGSVRTMLDALELDHWTRNR